MYYNYVSLSIEFIGCDLSKHLDSLNSILLETAFILKVFNQH